MADSFRQSRASIPSREIPLPVEKEEDKAYEEISAKIPKTGISMAGITKLFHGCVRDTNRFAEWLCAYYKYEDDANLFFPRKES